MSKNKISLDVLDKLDQIKASAPQKIISQQNETQGKEKSKAGRKPIAEEDKARNKLLIGFTDEEIAKLEEASKKARMSKAGLIKHLLNQAEVF